MSSIASSPTKYLPFEVTKKDPFGLSKAGFPMQVLSWIVEL